MALLGALQPKQKSSEKTPSFFHRLITMVGIVKQGLEDHTDGEASAAALILFGIIFVVTMINLYVSKKKTHY